MSTFSTGIFVQVKCMHVSMPIVLWQVLTNSAVRSEVRPPAFLLHGVNFDNNLNAAERTR